VRIEAVRYLTRLAKEFLFFAAAVFCLTGSGRSSFKYQGCFEVILWLISSLIKFEFKMGFFKPANSLNFETCDLKSLDEFCWVPPIYRFINRLTFGSSTEATGEGYPVLKFIV
jgi:hypothetical protein